MNYDFGYEVEDYVSSKQRERKTKDRPLGWSRWTLTKVGEDNQGFMRFYNDPNSMSMEPLRQIVYPHNGGFKALMQSDGNPEYFVYKFESQELAMFIVEQATLDNGWEVVINHDVLHPLMADWKEHKSFQSMKDLVDSPEFQMMSGGF